MFLNLIFCCKIVDYRLWGRTIKYKSGEGGGGGVGFAACKLFHLNNFGPQFTFPNSKTPHTTVTKSWTIQLGVTLLLQHATQWLKLNYLVGSPPAYAQNRANSVLNTKYHNGTDLNKIHHWHTTEHHVGYL